MFINFNTYFFLTQLVNVVWETSTFSLRENPEYYITYSITWGLTSYKCWKTSYQVGDKYPKRKLLGTYQNKKLAVESLTNVSSRLLDYAPKGWFVFCTRFHTPFGLETWIDFDKKIISLEDKEIEISLAHELGHLRAFERGLNRSDEVLAWQLGEEIWVDCFGTTPPEEFYIHKRKSLATYGIIVN